VGVTKEVGSHDEQIMSEKRFKVYRSSAGSGKTYTLVKEYLTYCLSSDQPYYFSKILAITFTNKASAEMKERIIETLKKATSEEAILKEPLLHDCWKDLGIDIGLFLKRAQTTLQKILHSYGDLSVSTIDKFMLKLIRSFSRDLQLPLNFEIEMQESQLRDRVISKIISEIGNDEGADKILIDYARRKINEGKSWKLDKELQDSSAKLSEEGSSSVLDVIAQLEYKEYIFLINDYLKKNSILENQMQLYASEALDLIRSRSIDPLDLAGGARGIGKYLLYLQDVDIRVPKALYTALEKQVFHAGKVDKLLKEQIVSIQAELSEILLNITTLYEKDGQNYLARRILLKQLPAQALLGKINLELEQLKKEEGLVNMSDFNHLISKVVKEEYMPFIYERIGERYNHIMVDEFQDTSVMQFQNLLPLIEESLSKGFESMIVGDAKQSIYRFRGAEVEQFSQMPNIEISAFEEGLNQARMDGLKRNFNPKSLDTNWRSAAEIVQFNNEFFEFVYEHGGLSERNQLIFEGHRQFVSERADQEGFVEIMKINGDTKAEMRSFHIDYLIETIQDLKQKEYQYEDIAILCMTKAELSEIAISLSAEGIPLISAEALKLQHSAVVNFLVDLLKWIEDPTNDEPKIQILNFLRDQGLIYASNQEIRDNYNIKSSNGLKQLFKDINLPVPSEPFSNENLFQWVERQVRAFGLDSSYDPYLQFFQEYVYEFVQRQRGDFREFLNAWELNGENLSIESNDRSNAVQLMTIHKSKGLEFPVVLLPFADYEINSKGKLLWADDLPDPASEIDLDHALINYNQDLIDTIFNDDYEKELIKREGDLMNSIYVAFTRAVNRLHIITVDPPKSRKSFKFSILVEDFIKLEGFENGKFSRGVDKVNPVKNTKAKQDEEEVVLRKNHSSSWNEKVSLSLDMNTEWKEEDGELGSRAYGNLVHEILASIQIKEDIPKVLEEYYWNGKINLQRKNELEIQLLDLISKEEIKEFFEPIWKISNERSFISSKFEVLRPDRIIENSEELRILDYKSGEKRDKDLTQLNNYAHELSLISKKKVSAYLLYLQDEDLVKVV